MVSVLAVRSNSSESDFATEFKDVRFEPSGFTNNPEIPTAKSVMDYVFRYIGMKYLSPKEREELFGMPVSTESEININLTPQVESKNETVLASTSLKNGKSNEPMVVTNLDAPACGNCGSLMVRAGSCYSCPNCFTTTGVCN